MKQFYIFLFTALTLIGLGSCSTYKSSTAPDNVYGTGSDGGGVSNDGYSNYSQGNSDYYSTPNDNYVRMRVQDPNRWSTFDDGNYDYYGSGYSNGAYASPFYPGVGYGFNSYMGYGGAYGLAYNPFFGTGLSFGYGMGYYDSYYLWNSFYNPYYGSVVVVNGHNAGTTPVTRGASFNPASYRGRSVSTRPAFSPRSASGGQIFSPNTATRGGRYYNSNSSSRPNLNNDNRPAYNSSSRPAQQTQSFSQPMRSAPSNFGSGGGGGGGGRAGGMSRPGR